MHFSNAIYEDVQMNCHDYREFPVAIWHEVKDTLALSTAVCWQGEDIAAVGLCPGSSLGTVPAPVKSHSQAHKFRKLKEEVFRAQLPQAMNISCYQHT